jgi:hypothetical protein
MPIAFLCVALNGGKPTGKPSTAYRFAFHGSSLRYNALPCAAVLRIALDGKTHQ